MNALIELERIGALITDSHIVYTSGKHGSAYVNKDALYPHTELTFDVTRQMAELVAKEEIDVVVAPAIGAVILGQLIARHLSLLKHKDILSVYAEKSTDGDGFVIKRGYDKLILGKKVLIVEDIVNTGGSVLKVVQTAKETGATIVGALALCNRGGITTLELDNIPWIRSLVEVELEAWNPVDCPMCKKRIPINTAVGKGKSAPKSSP